MHCTQKLSYGTTYTCGCYVQHFSYNLPVRAFKEQSFSRNVTIMPFFQTDIKKIEKTQRLFFPFARTQPFLQVVKLCVTTEQLLPTTISTSALSCTSYPQAAVQCERSPLKTRDKTPGNCAASTDKIYIRKDIRSPLTATPTFVTGSVLAGGMLSCQPFFEGRIPIFLP